jgi:hypothetical protein
MKKQSWILQVLVIFAFLILLLNTWMWGVSQVFPTAALPNISDLYKGVPLEKNPWLKSWQRWDTPQYQAIAERGYDAFDTALFTPPLYPFLIKWTAPLFNRNTLAAGLFLSGMAFLACLLAFHQLAQFEFKDEKDALRATLTLASFPSAFFLAAAYNESLFLLAAIMCLYCSRRNKWMEAGLWGAIAAGTRIPGVVLILPLAYAAWETSKFKDKRAWLAPTLTGMGALVFPAYVWLGLGRSPLDILTALNERGGHLAIPGWNIVEAVNRILQGQLIEENLIELIFTIIYIFLTVYIWKKLPRVYGVYAITMMLLFLTRLGSPQPLVSMARYVIEIFPAFLVLTIWSHSPGINRLILYLSWLGLLFFSAQFAVWGWVG